MLPFVISLAGNLVLWLWLATALVLWGITRGERGGPRRWYALALLVVLWVLPCRPVAEALLRPLEGRFTVPTVEELEMRGISQVVVLTGGGFERRGELSSDALPPASASRFLAGVELCARLGTDCRLIFSGSAGRGSRQVRTADHMARLARHLGFAGEIAAEADSGSTAEHPGNVRPLLRGRTFALVTSAYHMPRAMGSFRRAGLEPVAFPVAPERRGGFRWRAAVPSAEGLRTLQVAWREYLALALYGIRGL